MTTITISRQLGSFGDEVGEAIAKRLGYKLVHREVINQAALRAQAPEVALATIDDLGLLDLHPSRKAQKAYHQAVKKVMQEFAKEGDVIIIGRAGQVILRERRDVLHVKVIAPVSIRAERIADIQKISLQSAIAQIEASDRTRKNYLKRYYQARWDDPELYDLIVNTARLNPEEAAGLVCQALSKCIPSGRRKA